jgi:predicted nuclease with TOPRIM domain
MKPINIEKLLSHSIGISNSYYRPTENELLEDYLKVVDLLSIDKETKLQKQLNEYAEKNNGETYIIKGKLHEKDQEMVQLKKEYKLTNDTFAALSDKVSRLVQEIEFLKNK